MVWTHDEIIDYVKEGYNEMTLLTGCLWETACLPDYAMAFNYTSEFELQFMLDQEEWLIAGMANFTSEMERDFIDNGVGPANHTAFWEFDDGHVTETLVAGLVELPENLHKIERATWNTKKIEPLRSRELEEWDSRYELNKGEVRGYVMDKDGLDVLRKWRVPSAAYVPYTFTDDSDPYGILRRAGDISDEVVIGGEWGVLRRIPGQLGTGSEWGTVRAVYKEQNNVRIEYQRRGSDLDANTPFEIPDRSVKYLMHFAMWKALIRDGPGQSPDLAIHYKERYEVGIARMIRRKSALQFQKKVALGGSRNIRNTRLPLARLPWQYSAPIR